MADLSQITLPNGDTYNFKDSRISASNISAWNTAAGSLVAMTSAEILAAVQAGWGSNIDGDNTQY